MFIHVLPWLSYVLFSFGALISSELSGVASNVKGAVITNSGHWIMEEQPRQAIGTVPVYRRQVRLPFVGATCDANPVSH